MRAAISLIFLAGSLLAQAPAAGSKVLMKTDSFTGAKEFLTEVAKVREPSWKDGILAGLESSAGRKASQAWSLGFIFTTNNPEEGPYRLVLAYQDESWLFIPEGESLAFNADGTILSLSGPGSLTRREVRRGSISELAVYTVTQDQLNTLAKASVLKVRVTGKSEARTITWEKDRQVLADFAAFINQRRKPAPAPPKIEAPAQPPAAPSAESKPTPSQ